jgi:hypothetical protein
VKSFSDRLVFVLIANTPTANDVMQTVAKTMPTCTNSNLFKSLKASVAALTTMGNDTNMAGYIYSPCETNLEGEGIVYCAME